MGRGLRVEGSMNYVLDISAAEGEFGAENWIDYALEKLREKLKEFLAKLEEVFQPETRVEQLKHWARVAAPYIVAALALWILLRYFRGCCCRVVGRGGSAVKTMIAPGTAGAVRILRAPFEANPAAYFRGLR